MCLWFLLRISRKLSVQILRLHGVLKHGPHVVLVLQLAAQSLHQLLSVSPSAISERKVARIMGHALRGLAHAHASGWSHRDIAPGNVLILPSGDTVLSDWGQATRTASTFQAAAAGGGTLPSQAAASDEGGASTAAGSSSSPQRGGAVDPLGLPHDAVGTRWYKPPEVLLGAPSGGSAGDVWAFGMVLAEVLRQGEPLCAGSNDIAQLGLIMRTFGKPDETQWPAVTQLPDYGKLQFNVKGGAVPLHRLLPSASAHALEAVRGCLQLTPAHRIAARTLLKLPFFAGTAHAAAGDKAV